MSAPKCKLCGANHWSNEDHKFPDDPKPKKAAPKPKEPVKEPEPVSSVPESEPVGEHRVITANGLESPEKVKQRVYEWRQRNREEYNKYMRDLMKAKRAKARE